MNYFVEGLMGSGKSTLVKRLSEKYPDCTAVMEGDYSPVELAWCALMTDEEYSEILTRWPDLRDQIAAKAHREGDRRIVCYTQVKSDDRDFYRQLENYEIYNGRTAFARYRDIVLSRYRSWNGDGNIFECSLLQNAVEDMILFRDMPDDAILDFYKDVRAALEGKDYEICYIESPDIARNVDTVRKERVDESGNEVWFSMLMGFFVNSPYAKKRSLNSYEDLLEHLRHRQALELRICRESFGDRLRACEEKSVKR